MSIMLPHSHVARDAMRATRFTGVAAPIYDIGLAVYPRDPSELVLAKLSAGTTYRCLSRECRNFTAHK
jgi:hypothetical protein